MMTNGFGGSCRLRLGWVTDKPPFQFDQNLNLVPRDKADLVGRMGKGGA